MREDWIEIDFGKVILQSKEKHKPERIEKLFFVGLEHIEKNSGELTEDVGEEEINTVKNKFEKGQILYGKLRPYLNKAHLAKRAGVCSTDILVFEVSDVVFPEYAIHYVLSRKFVNDMSANTSGVNLPRVSTKYIKNYPFPLAPLPEQRSIVAKIEELFSELDNGIANLKAAKEKLEIYRQAVLKKAFEGELTKEWRERQNHDAKDNLDDPDSTSSNQAHQENQDSDNGKLPEGWKVVEVKEISERIQYGYTQSSSYEKIGPKFLRITDIQDDKVNWKTVPYCRISEIELKKYLLKEGDLVFARTGATVGKSFLIKGDIPESVFASYLIRIRFLESILDKYVWYFFRSHLYWMQIKKKSVGTGQPNVNGKKLGEVQLPICSKSEQTQIVQEIETRLSVCDKVLADINEALEKSEALRQSILKKAFEGKLLNEEELEACRQEPDWKPAEKLLERIKGDSNSNKETINQPSRMT